MKILSPINENKDIIDKKYVDDGLSGKQATLISGTNIKTINNESILGSGNINISGGNSVAIDSDYEHYMSTEYVWTNIDSLKSIKVTASGQEITLSYVLCAILNMDEDALRENLSEISQIIALFEIPKTALQQYELEGETYVNGTIFVSSINGNMEIKAYQQSSESELWKINHIRVLNSIFINGVFDLGGFNTTPSIEFLYKNEVKKNKVTAISSSSTDDEYPSAKAVYSGLQLKQNSLVSGTNIKTINNESILGSGNINISGGGSSTDVQINGTSITNNDVANILTNTAYNDSTNKIATMSDVPTNNNQLTNGAGYITGISSSDVTTALGYTPYNSTNPDGYTSNTGTITGITMNGASKGISGVVDLGTVITAHQDISGKLDTAKVKNANSTTAGDVYDVRYINTMLGDIESLLGGI